MNLVQNGIILRLSISQNCYEILSFLKRLLSIPLFVL
jgi:hypothetical protein